MWAVCADLFPLGKCGLNSDSSRLGIFLTFHIVFAFHFQYIPSLHCSVFSCNANTIMECKCRSSNCDYTMMWFSHFFYQYCGYNFHPTLQCPKKKKNPDLALYKATWKNTRQTFCIFFPQKSIILMAHKKLCSQITQWSASIVMDWRKLFSRMAQ